MDSAHARGGSAGWQCGVVCFYLMSLRLRGGTPSPCSQHVSRPDSCYCRVYHAMYQAGAGGRMLPPRSHSVRNRIPISQFTLCATYMHAAIRTVYPMTVCVCVMCVRVVTAVRIVIMSLPRTTSWCDAMTHANAPHSYHGLRWSRGAELPFSYVFRKPVPQVQRRGDDAYCITKSGQA